MFLPPDLCAVIDLEEIDTAELYRCRSSSRMHSSIFFVAIRRATAIGCGRRRTSAAARPGSVRLASQAGCAVSALPRICSHGVDILSKR